MHCVHWFIQDICIPNRKNRYIAKKAHEGMNFWNFWRPEARMSGLKFIKNGVKSQNIIKK